MKKRKGQAVNFGSLMTIVGLIIVAVLFLTLGGDVVGDVNSDFANAEGRENCGPLDASNCTSAAVTVSGAGLSSLTNLSGQLPNVGTVVGAALIIGVLVGSFIIGRRFV